MYVMNNPTKWEDFLHLAEFAYKNGYLTFAKMTLFEVLYGWKCRKLVTWDSPMDHVTSHASTRGDEATIDAI